MDIRNCKKCGKIFAYLGRALCPVCLQKEEADFESIKKFLDDNPNAKAEDIEEGTGIPLEQIMNYLESGRLILKEGAPALLKCRSCGKPITTGMLCEACAGRLAHKFEEAAKPQKTVERQMHTWESKRDGQK